VEVIDMALVRWDPFRELTSLQNEVNRLFTRIGGGEVGDRQAWMPSVDVIETPDAIQLKAELAGIDPKDIKLEVDENVLTLSGERRFEEEVHEDKYYRIERRYGSFSRSIALPQNVQADSIDANFENGVLTVSVPKVPEVQPKRIQVTVKGGPSGTVEGVATERDGGQGEGQAE
jgi:HSP20 family protein